MKVEFTIKDKEFNVKDKAHTPRKVQENLTVNVQIQRVIQGVPDPSTKWVKTLESRSV